MILSYSLAILVSAFVLTGACLTVLAAIGVLRLPDVYSRMHAASIAGTVGSGLIMIGFAVHAGQPGLAIRAIATLLFLMMTAPVAAHLLAKAASAARDPRPAMSVRRNRKTGGSDQV